MTATLSNLPRIARTQHPVRPLRILFALPGLHRVVRGAEVAFEEVSRCIAKIPGFQVTLIGSGPDRAAEPYQYRQTRCIPRERFEKWPRIPYLRDHFGYEELSFAPGLLRSFSPENFDLTVTCGYPYTNIALRARRKDRWPRHVFVTQNGDWMVQSQNWEYKHFGCDGLICTNPDYFDRHRDRWPSVLIPNGVNPDVFQPGPQSREALNLPPGVPIALIVSALSPSKRVLEGIACVSRVPGVHMVIAGDGELRNDVQQAGNTLMPGRFHMLKLPRQQMPSLYRSADVFLHMSQDEPSANAYIEALAIGLPIVTHDRRVTRWTLEDQALLIDTSDEAAVVAALKQAMTLRQESAARARRELALRRFSWNSIAQQYCRFFQAVCTPADPQSN
jgi:glycosyltransferase involved in cell wall biosynthesis